jgi:hypothetical protein
MRLFRMELLARCLLRNRTRRVGSPRFIGVWRAPGERLVTYTEVCGRAYPRTIPERPAALKIVSLQHRESRALRYFVNVTANAAVLHDPGEEFSDLYEACTHAVELAAELVAQYPRKVKNVISGVPLAVEVVDSNGAIIFRSPVG